MGEWFDIPRSDMKVTNLITVPDQMPVSGGA